MFALPLSANNTMPSTGNCYSVDFDLLNHGDNKDFFHGMDPLSSNNNKEAINFSQNTPHISTNLSFAGREPGQEQSPQTNHFHHLLFPSSGLQQQHQYLENHQAKYNFNSQVLSPSSAQNPPAYTPPLVSTQVRDATQSYSYFPPSPMKPNSLKMEQGGMSNSNYIAFINRQRKAPTKVPTDLKSDSYWKRRNKNNLSAKKSRDKKRIEEKRLMQEFCLLSEELYKDLLAYYTLQKAKDLVGGTEMRRRRAAELPYGEEIQQFYYYEGLLFGLKEANKNKGLPLRALIPWKQCYEDLNMWTDRRFIAYVNSEQLSSSGDSSATAYFPANFPSTEIPQQQ